MKNPESVKESKPAKPKSFKDIKLYEEEENKEKEEDEGQISSNTNQMCSPEEVKKRQLEDCPFLIGTARKANKGETISFKDTDIILSDTGSQRNVAPLSWLEENNVDLSKINRDKLFILTGTVSSTNKVVGEIFLDICLKSKSNQAILFKDVQFLVLDKSCTLGYPLLGSIFFQKYNGEIKYKKHKKYVSAYGFKNGKEKQYHFEVTNRYKENSLIHKCKNAIKDKLNKIHQNYVEYLFYCNPNEIEALEDSPFAQCNGNNLN